MLNVRDHVMRDLKSKLKTSPGGVLHGTYGYTIMKAFGPGPSLLSSCDEGGVIDICFPSWHLAGTFIDNIPRRRLSGEFPPSYCLYIDDTTGGPSMEASTLSYELSINLTGIHTVVMNISVLTEFYKKDFSTDYILYCPVKEEYASADEKEYPVLDLLEDVKSGVTRVIPDLTSPKRSNPSERLVRSIAGFRARGWKVLYNAEDRRCLPLSLQRHQEIVTDILRPQTKISVMIITGGEEITLSLDIPSSSVAISRNNATK